MAVRDVARGDVPDLQSRRWATVTESMFDTLADCRFLMPKNMKHLSRSVRAAIGEGFALLVRTENDVETRELNPEDYLWRQYALEYVDLAIDGMRLWRDSSQRASGRVGVLNFDAWLSATGRHEPIGGAGAWKFGRY
jgi:hypothetical protein